MFAQAAVVTIDTETRMSFVDKLGEEEEEEVSFIDANTFPNLENRLDALAALMEKGGRLHELEQKLKRLLATAAPTAAPTTAPTVAPTTRK